MTTRTSEPSSERRPEGDLHSSVLSLVTHLTDPTVFAPRPAQVELRETHISWVFLTDEFAYKLKKALADVSLEEQAIADALADLPTKDREGAVKALRSAWRPYQGRGDANDPCVARLFGDRNPAFLEDGETICPAFARAALTLWRPIVTARKAPRKRPVFGGAA